MTIFWSIVLAGSSMGAGYAFGLEGDQPWISVAGFVQGLSLLNLTQGGRS